MTSSHKKTRPHNPWKHDEHDTDHDHDSDNDSDKEHDEDQHDADGEHQHDEHSAHHHHDITLETSDGKKHQFSLFHHDPDHGTVPKHLHDVTLTLKDGTKKEISVWHEGAEHEDVDGSHPYAFYLNSKRVRYPYKHVKPLEVAQSTVSVSSSSTSEKIKPSAPPLDQLSESKATKVSSNSNSFQNTQQQETLRKKLLEDMQKEEGSKCCPTSCVIL